MVELKELNFGYNSKALFTGINLTLQPGNLYGLLGLNGAGKSTLLKLIAGLLFPTSGELRVLDYEPEQRLPSFLSKLFVLPENIVMPNVTDRQYVAMSAPFYPQFDQQHFERCLTEFEVPREQKLNTLSHGQQKKFLLSFGLACRAELLILDEPSNGLDIPSKGLFRRLVAESLSENQIFVVSTHQVQDIESLVDSIVILHNGDVLLNKSITDVSGNLRMSSDSLRPEPDPTLLYSEQTVGGYASIWQDSTSPDGQIDLELLFKAIINSPAQFQTLFNR
ncbi:MAG: ABC transporter ATP-binding protein [Acidiferrobacterales bacterium]|nr:ABC transporter ATP-binding protein [Acidiferrobacterales bacterium]